MPLSPLDDTIALVVVDLQAGTLTPDLVRPARDVVANAATLVAAFHHRTRPVVFATVTGMPSGRTQYGAGERAFPAEFARLSPDLDVRAEDTLLTRSTWSAFAGTDLHARLRAAGVTQIVIAGVATTFGVESTARAAYDLGFSVVIAGDAISDRSLEAHEHSLGRVFPALGQVAPTAEITAGLPRTTEPTD